MSPRSRSRPGPSVAMTPRGTGMLASGIVVGALGVGLSTPVLVYVGVVMTCAVVSSWVWVVLSLSTFVGRVPQAHREVHPRPLSVGSPGDVTVTVRAARSPWHGPRTRRALAAGLDLREQAAPELTGGIGTRATVRRSAEALALHYTLHPVRRGRWALGPVTVRRRDVFGTLSCETSMGEGETVAVWPAVVDLTGTASALMGTADRIVLGARIPSADDASLRDYREGDDLRRIHWASSARTGTLLVRSDERAGRRPATVILDLPRDPVALEWSITAAASIGVSVLATGHPVRLLGAGMSADAGYLGERDSWAARAALLTRTIDIEMPASRALAASALRRAVHRATETAVAGEVTVGVFEPLERAVLDALVPVGDSGRAWAIVREGSTGDADATVTALRHAGWRVTAARSGDSLEVLWNALLAAEDGA